jgi:hypothetical protein
MHPIVTMLLMMRSQQILSNKIKLLEDIDFTPILGKTTGGRPSVDYGLSLDCAKAYIMIASESITFIL